MKKILSFLLLAGIVLFTSCKTTRLTPQRQPDEFFLADLNEMDLGTISCLTAFGKTKTKATDVTFSINPRTNELVVRFRLGIDVIELVYTYAERNKINDTITTYLEDVKDSNLAHRKPNKKNSYILFKDGYVGWGLTLISHRVYDVLYFTNYEFLENNKPYFKMQYYSSKEKEKKDIGSPYFAIYLTPVQLRKIREICDQDAIMEKVNAKLSAVYTFDDEDDGFFDSEEEGFFEGDEELVMDVEEEF